MADKKALYVYANADAPKVLADAGCDLADLFAKKPEGTDRKFPMKAGREAAAGVLERHDHKTVFAGGRKIARVLGAPAGTKLFDSWEADGRTFVVLPEPSKLDSYRGNIALIALLVKATLKG